MSQPVRGWKWCIITNYTYLWLCGRALVPVQLLFFLSYWHLWWRFLFPCANSRPGAHWEMLAPFTMSMGEFVEKRLCLKLVIGKAKPLPLGNSLVLVAVGTEENIMAREQSPFSEWVPDFPWDVLDAQLSFSLTAPLSVCCVLSLVKVELLHLPQSQPGINPREGRGKVWCRCWSPCRTWGDPSHTLCSTKVFLLVLHFHSLLAHLNQIKRARAEFQQTSGSGLVLHHLQSKMPRRKRVLYVDQLQSHLLHR